MYASYRQLQLETLSGLLLLWLASPLQPGAAQSLLPNGSFEEGARPAGWRARPGGTVTKGDAHRGERSASRASSRRSVVWESDSAAISPQNDYRLAGWIRCPKGEGQLDVELTDDVGKILSRSSTPMVRRVAGWQYTAVEWNAAQATSARVAFRVQGRADLDDVVLSTVAESFIGNKSVDGDERGPGRNWTKWSAPEEHTDNKVGTADDPIILPGEGNSPFLIGGWARLSVLLKQRGVGELSAGALASFALAQPQSHNMWYLLGAERLARRNGGGGCPCPTRCCASAMR